MTIICFHVSMTIYTQCLLVFQVYRRLVMLLLFIMFIIWLEIQFTLMSVTAVSEVLFQSYAYGSRCCFYDVFVLTLACMTCSQQESSGTGIMQLAHFIILAPHSRFTVVREKKWFRNQIFEPTIVAVFGPPTSQFVFARLAQMVCSEDTRVYTGSGGTSLRPVRCCSCYRHLVCSRVTNRRERERIPSL